MFNASLYTGLFITAFLAATILPVASEGALAAALATSGASWPALIAVASVGNVLGSIVNWCIGRALAQERSISFMRVDRKALARAEAWYHRYGRWSLLLSWAPLIGDPLTVAAGLMREPLRFFIPIVIAAKTGRYLVVAAIIAGFL